MLFRSKRSESSFETSDRQSVPEAQRGAASGIFYESDEEILRMHADELGSIIGIERFGRLRESGEEGIFLRGNPYLNRSVTVCESS